MDTLTPAVANGDVTSPPETGGVYGAEAVIDANAVNGVSAEGDATPRATTPAGTPIDVSTTVDKVAAVADGGASAATNSSTADTSGAAGPEEKESLHSAEVSVVSPAKE